MVFVHLTSAEIQTNVHFTWWAPRVATEGHRGEEGTFLHHKDDDDDDGVGVGGE